MDEIKYEFLRVKDGKKYYRADMKTIVHPSHKNSKGFYDEVCPVCRHKHELGEDGFYLDPNYNKRKLSVLPSMKVAHCNRCDSVIVDFNEDVNIYIPQWNYKGLIDEDFSIVKLPDVDQKYDKCRKLNDAEVATIKARNPNLDPEILGMRHMKWDRPNVLMPFYIAGELVYYQLRFLDNQAPKYFSPSIRNKPIYVPKGVECNGKIILCEGVYDALALCSSYPGYLALAILGCHITSYQINLIRKFYNPNEILIFMDDTGKSEDIRKSLESDPISYYCDIDIIESDGSDAEEILRESIGLPKIIDIASIYENNIRK